MEMKQWQKQISMELVSQYVTHVSTYLKKMEQKNVSSLFNHTEEYKEMGFSVSELGAVMVGCSNPLTVNLPGDNEYVSERFDFVNGVADSWHITLRYGLLPQVRPEYVEALVEKFGLPQEVPVKGISMWPSKVEGEDYECVVVTLLRDQLKPIHQELGVLPNVLGFPSYRPHVTVGYFKPGWYEKNQLELNLRLKPSVKLDSKVTVSF